MQGCIHFTLPAVPTSPRSTLPRSPVPGLRTQEVQLAGSQGASCSSQMGALLVPKLVRQPRFCICFTRHSFVGDRAPRDFSCQGGAARSAEWPPGPLTHLLRARYVGRPGHRSWLPAPPLASEAHFPENGLESSGALRGILRTLSHAEVLRPELHESHLILMWGPQAT